MISFQCLFYSSIYTPSLRSRLYRKVYGLCSGFGGKTNEAARKMYLHRFVCYSTIFFFFSVFKTVKYSIHQKFFLQLFGLSINIDLSPSVFVAYVLIFLFSPCYFLWLEICFFFFLQNWKSIAIYHLNTQRKTLCCFFGTTLRKY